MDMSEVKRQSPYQGLVPYEEEDASWFFGREKETRLIIANLFASPLTLLYGASGVGKSSVLGAGVVHQLRQRADLLVVLFKSWQGDPAAELEAAIADAALRAPVQKMPSTPPSSLADCLTACMTRVGGLGRRLMIILDQFEEYFLYHPQDDAFAEQFPALLTQTGLPVSFLISIREDSWAKLDRFEARIPILFDNYLRIDYLDREAARSAIETPIARYNELQEENHEPFKIEPELVEAVLDQVKTGQVVLADTGRGAVRQGAGPASEEARIETPYLQLVMTRLWDEELKEKSHVLRLTTLNEKLGGAKRIVRTHLDETLIKLNDGEQQIVARIFHYLVTPSGTKIAQTLPDLAEYAGVPGAQIEPLLEKLGRQESRLVRAVPPPPGQLAAARYEIFHDVLAPAILDWRARYVRAQELTEARKKEEEASRRAQEQARQAKRFRRLSWALGAVLVLGVVALVVAIWQWTIARGSERRAQENQRLATVRALVASSVNYLQDNPEKSLLLATYALSTTHPSDGGLVTGAEDVLRRAARATPSVILRGHQAPVRGVAWSSDGKLLATASDDGTVKVWDTITGKPVRELCRRAGVRDSILGIAWRPDSHQIAAVGEDGFMRVWDAETWKEVSLESADLPRSRTPAVGWSQDGSRLATADWEGNINIWNSEQHRSSFSGPHTPIWCLAWSPASSRLATGYRDREVRVWDAISEHMLLKPLFTGTPVWGVSWNYNGQLLATGGQDWHARVFDTREGTRPLRLDRFDDAVCSVAWGPKGAGQQDRSELLATGSRTVGVFRIYRYSGLLHYQEKLQLGLHRGAIYAVAWDPQGQRLAAGSTDYNTYIYSLDILDADTTPLLMKVASERVHTGLTSEECQAYFLKQACPPIP
jgi:WD40 repeat protein